jgi:hypothetical protein
MAPDLCGQLITVLRMSACRLVVDPIGDLRDAARRCEAEVITGRFGGTLEAHRVEFAPYEDTSVWVVVADDDDRILGAARYVMPSPAGLKSLDDVGSGPWGADGYGLTAAAGLDLRTTWDVATITHRTGGHQGIPVTAALLHGLIQVSRHNGVTATVAILDREVRILLARSFGLEYHALPDTRTLPWLGSPASTPVYAPFAAQMDTARRRNPEGHRLVVLGAGLDGIEVPGAEQFVIRHRVIDLRSPLPTPRSGVRGEGTA